VPESGSLGFVRGAPSNGRPYRDHSHDQTMNEATTDERRYTGGAGSAAR
jgi:hypothetical protein